MEERSSTNSPRSIFKFFKNRPTNASFSDADNQPSSPTRFRQKKSEVYGFIGSITVVVVTVISIIWAYVRNRGYWLDFVGTFYYQSRYWASSVPSYVMAGIVLAIGLYTGLSFLATPPPTSLKSMFDEYSNEALSFLLPENEDDERIEPISDISNY
ncbi:hypothetical protein ABFX02_14G157800 [Erythranthe guttata]